MRLRKEPEIRLKMAALEATLPWETLPELFPDLEEPERWLPLLREHAELLAATPVQTTTVKGEEVVARHFAESLEAYRLAGAPEAGRAVDVGSGGGFPGLVMAAVAPGIEVHLVEARKKRAELLAELAERLGLSNVTVSGERAEEAGRGPLRDGADLAIARAVAPLPVLLEYLAPLTAPGGTIAAVKGSRGESELTEAEAAIEALNCEHTATEAMRAEVGGRMRVLLFRKTGPTPPRYPRRPGIPRKRPIA
ncbi:MAG: 16S rRNA (guanine(527)-N(7))-methyltransferase RsmG [Dehalococcoidia bacterium]|nr:16S rRNA (guanine(527)-N(7))-methyltransferase RsmG [Dehalococcoidia bacterium]MYA53526.1 16S rRNA (guanine(527)-N(7))-methyltransferase RsmG [Dehalococcoidia bacterium]